MQNRYKTLAEYLLEDSSQFKKGEKVQIKNSGMIGIISDINSTTGAVIIKVDDDVIETTKDDIDHIVDEVDYEPDNKTTDDTGIESSVKKVGDR